MADLLLVAVILAFFAVAALVVRALDRVVADSADGVGFDDDAAITDEAAQGR